MVPPDRFIPIAESHGLMEAIGDWVLQRACRQARQWLDEGMANAPLAVNISAIQLRSGDLHDKVGSALRDHCLPPELLELELTESLLLDDVADGLSQFDRLKRSLGVKLAVDDFGTGYSNLSSLGRFPADRLKIDRSFIAGMHSDERASSIVATIIQLGHNLGFRVIAEGVETAQDRALLQALDCDEIQGYLIGRPMPAAEVLPWWQAFNATTAA
jgi:EAL domain-containing protein (putative c-di-GMP-specific phosphodiesterase class I)